MVLGRRAELLVFSKRLKVQRPFVRLKSTSSILHTKVCRIERIEELQGELNDAVHCGVAMSSVAQIV